jgi:hypothetical protein
VPPPPSKPALAPLLTRNSRPPRPPNRPFPTTRAAIRHSPGGATLFAHWQYSAQPGPLLDPPVPVSSSRAPVPVPGSRYAVPGTGGRFQPPGTGSMYQAAVPGPQSQSPVPRTGRVPGTGSRYQATASSAQTSPPSTVRSPLPSRGGRPYNYTVSGSGSREVELAKAGRSLGAAPVDVSYLSAALAAEPGADRVPGHLPRVPRRVPGDAVRRLLELRRQLPRPQGP